MKIETFFLLLGLLSAPAFAEPPGIPNEQALIEHVRAGPSLLNSNFQSWAAGYHPDWSYWRLGSSETRPRDIHMPLVEENINNGMHIDDFDVEIVEVFVSGDLGFVRYNATEHLTQGDGIKRVVRFSAASLYTRETGQWQTLRSNLVYAPPTHE
jgi:hypothetical protein